MKKRIFIDMDGCLAVWNEQATLEDTYQKGYFLKRTPEKNLVSAVDSLAKMGYPIHILSHAYNKDVVEEKRAWLYRYAPHIKEENMFFPLYGDNKSEYIKATADDILIDDFSKNLLSWKGRAIKFLNGINGTKGTWKGEILSHKMSAVQIGMAIYNLF